MHDDRDPTTRRYDAILRRIPWAEREAACARVLADMEEAGEYFTRARFLDRLDGYAASVELRRGDATS